MTTVYSQAVTGDNGGAGNENDRQVIPSSLLSSATGSQCQLVFKFGSSEVTENPAIGAVYFGQSGVTPPSFTGDQVQVLFGGSGTAAGSAGATLTSDVFTLAQAFDNTKSYTCAWYGASAAHCSEAFLSPVTGDNFYTDSGTTGSSTANQTAPAGMSLVSDFAQFLTQIIITSGDTLGGAMQRLMMSQRRRDPVKTLILPSRYARRTRGFATAA